MGSLIAITVASALAQPQGAPSGFVRELIAAAVAQTAQSVVYDGSYRRIPYPGGDVPPHIGVCTE